MTRAAFLVDGFNLYHSLRAAELALGGVGTRWLDLRALCESLLGRVGGHAQLARVDYFSALAVHLNGKSPETTRRHERYLACLEETGVQVHLGHFKRVETRCVHCRRRLVRHEEKETDVAIGVSLVERLLDPDVDAAVIMTGDSDQASAIRRARALFPAKRVIVAFPFDRVSDELRSVASSHFRIGAKQYARFQLPVSFTTRRGAAIEKPAEW